MSDKEDDETSDTKKIGPGVLLTFGSIDLIFTLNLEKHDLKKYKVKWEKLETIDNLKFIRKHKHFWKRIELSSNNDTMNIILHINKSSQKLIKIGYIAFEKIKYKDKQEDFENLIDSVTTQNGLFITSCDVCKCSICVQLVLKYENNEKSFIILGETETEKEVKGEDDNKIEEEHVVQKDEEKKTNNKEEQKDEKKNEDNNPFAKINEDIVSPRDFNYIYFNYNDYVNGEFSSNIKIEHLYEYIQTLKITTKSKIILNLEEETIENNVILRDLLSLVDIFIFYDKNKLYDILKQLKEIEDNSNTEKLYAYHFREVEKKNLEKEENRQKEEERVKNYKAFLERNKNEKKLKKNQNKSIEKQEKNQQQTEKKENIYITQGDDSENDKEKKSEVNKVNELINNGNNKEENKEEKKEDNKPNDKDLTEQKKDGQNKENEKIEGNENEKEKDIIKQKSNSLLKKNKLMPLTIRLSPPTPLGKNEIFDYFKYGICDRDPQRKTSEKILLVLDEFKKIFFIKYNKNDTKPNISDYDLKLYPQMNLRNMNEILEFKKFIKSKFNEYVKIFIGSLLSIVLPKSQDKIDEDSLLLGYLCATNTIKKLAEIQKYNLPIPKEKDFFYPSINKSEVEKIITKVNQRKKEKLFILDGNTKKNSIIKPYNPLLDKNLISFFNSRNNQNFLKMNGFIKNDGEINYDPVYRETLGFSKLSNKDEKDVYKSFQTTNKFLFGYNKNIPSYSIYNQKNNTKNTLILPPITQIKTQPTAEKKRDTIDEEEGESGSGSGSGGSGSGDDSGSGSGSGDESNDKE